MNTQFIEFLSNLSQKSGQTALCEAIKQGYMACLESAASEYPMTFEEKLDTFKTICDTLGAGFTGVSDMSREERFTPANYDRHRGEIGPRSAKMHSNAVTAICNALTRGYAAHMPEVTIDGFRGTEASGRYVNFLKQSGFDARIGASPYFTRMSKCGSPKHRAFMGAFEGNRVSIIVNLSNELNNDLSETSYDAGTRLHILEQMSYSIPSDLPTNIDMWINAVKETMRNVPIEDKSWHQLDDSLFRGTAWLPPECVPEFNKICDAAGIKVDTSDNLSPRCIYTASVAWAD